MGDTTKRHFLIKPLLNCFILYAGIRLIWEGACWMFIYINDVDVDIDCICIDVMLYALIDDEMT